MIRKVIQFITLFRNMMEVLNSRQKRNCAFVFVLIVFGGFLELLGVSAVLPVVEMILTPDDFKKSQIYHMLVGFTNVNSDKEIILLLSVGVAILYLVKNLYLTFSTYKQTSLVANVRYTMSEKTLSAYMKNDYSFFVNENSSVVIRGLTTDIDAYLNSLQNFFNIGVRLVNIVLICIWLMKTDIVLTLVVVILGVLAMGLITGAFKRKMRSLGKVRREVEASTLKSITQIVAGIKEVKILNKNDYFIELYGKAVKNRCSVDVWYTTLSPCPERIIETIFIGGLLLSVGLLSYLGRVNNAFVANLGIFAVASFRMLPFVSQLSGEVNIMMYTYEPTVAALRNIKGTFKEDGSSRPESDTIKSFEDELELKDVVFSYEGGTYNVLDGVNLKIKKGDAIALVGPSGAGKTTLADIILGLNRIKSGEILVDKRRVNMGENSWGKLIGYVSQNIFMLDDSIRNNIAFGCKPEEIDEKRLKDVIDQAQLTGFIASLPDGLDTNIGEGGAKVSGGQRQRIAIARALYLDPEILILDEATSALDSDTEQAVMEAIDMLRSTKTLIIVAHRLSTIEKCRHVYEVRDGAVCEKRLKDGRIE